jgi:uncharacterized lipoprotein
MSGVFGPGGYQFPNVGRGNAEFKARRVSYLSVAGGSIEVIELSAPYKRMWQVVGRPKDRSAIWVENAENEQEVALKVARLTIELADEPTN